MTTMGPTSTASPARGRGLDITLRVVQVLLGLFLVLASAVPKFYGDPYAVAIFAQIGAGQWLRYGTGVLELAGGIGLMIPRWAGLAALGLTGLMVGAVLTQAVVLGAPAMAIFPAVLGVVFVLIAWYRLSHP